VSHPFGGRPHAVSRVQLTGGRMRHSCVRGGVSSSRTPTASGMALQCLGWGHDGGGGCTGPMATEGRASLVRHHGVAPCERGTGVRPPFEGSAVLFRGCGTPVVREWVAQCHGANTGLTTQCRTVAGMASPRGLAEQRRDMTPRNVGGTACARSVRALNVPVGGAGTGAVGPQEPRARRASLEGASSPRTRRNPTRGGDCPSSEAEPLPRGRPTLK
jgi:hypothetical protein